MKMSFADHKSFNSKQHPSVIKTSRLTSQILTKLELSVKYNKDKCKLISASIIQDLDLPGKNF